MRLISLGISVLMFALVGCAASPDNGAASSAADTTADPGVGANGSDNPNDPVMIAVMSIPDAVQALESAEVLPGVGNDDARAVEGATSLEAVKAYIASEYQSAPEDGAGFAFEPNATAFDETGPVAGTFSVETAIKVTLEVVADRYASDDAATASARADEIRGLLQSIAAAGGSFGFDGFGQNTCSGATPKLLVVDPADKTVFGVDLNPCAED